MLRFVVIVAIVMSGVVSASAHTVEAERSFRALMHTEPADDPVVGEPSVVRFTIEAESSQFDAVNCQCVLVIRVADEEIARPELWAENDRTLSATVTFPRAEQYSLMLSGQSTSGQAVELTFALRVSRSSSSQLPLNGWIRHAPHYAAVVVIGGFVLWTILRERTVRIHSVQRLPKHPK